MSLSETIESLEQLDRAKEHFGLRDKQIHMVSTYETADGRLLVRFGPKKVIVLTDADRDEWFEPVDLQTARKSLYPKQPRKRPRKPFTKNGTQPQQRVFEPR